MIKSSTPTGEYKNADSSVGHQGWGYVDFFSTSARQGLIQQLLYLLRFGDGIPVVQGAGRTGKTAIANELIAQLAGTPYLAQIEIEPNVPFTDILVDIVTALGLKPARHANAGELLAELRRFAQALENDKALGILIIDNANYLDDQGLAALVSLLQGNNASGYGLHLVFFAQPDLVARIDEIGLVDVSVYDFDVPMLSVSELAEFLKRHLEGLDAAHKKLSAATVQSIWSRSHGAPGYSLHLMLEHVRNEATHSKSIFKDIPLSHVLALSVLLVVLVWALWVRESDTDSSETPIVADSGVSKPEKNSFEENSSAENTSVGNKQPGENLLQQPEPTPTVKRQQNFNVESTPAPQVTQSSPLPAINELDPIQRPTSQSTITQSPTVQPRAPDPVETEIADNTVSRSAATPVPTLAPTIKPATPTPEIVALTPPSRPAAGNQSLSGDEQFLLQQQPAYFTLQVMAASSKSALDSFINSQTNRDSLYLYESRRNGQKWYILVAGIYPDRDAASQAIDKLPGEQKKVGPWPREVSEVQREINVNHGN